MSLGFWGIDQYVKPPLLQLNIRLSGVRLNDYQVNLSVDHVKIF